MWDHSGLLFLGGLIFIWLSDVTALRPVCPPGQLACLSNHRCIPLEQHCDGRMDCPDNSDELKCESICNLEHSKFACGGGGCVNISVVCDDKSDCPDNSDEGGACGVPCHENVCSSNMCIKTPQGPKCLCPPGHKLADDGKTCEDHNECSEVGEPVCSQICGNVAGNFTCACHSGYRLQPDGRHCKALDPPTLIFSTEDNVYRVQLNKNQIPETITGETVRSMLAVDVAKNRVFLSAAAGNKVLAYDLIYKRTSPLVSYGLRSVRSLSFDWVNHLLYLIDSDLACIIACHVNQEICARVHCDPDVHFRAVTVSPRTRQLFWSEVRNVPKIGGADLDGYQRGTLVNVEVKEVVDMVVDDTVERLYWADRGLGRIESIKLDRSHRRLLVETEELSPPVALAVFEDLLYYISEGADSINVVDKFTGKRLKTLSEIGQMYSLTMFNEAVQSEVLKSECEDAPCSHVCLASRLRSYTCTCPDGMKLSADGTTCENDSEFPYLLAASKTEVLRVLPQAVGKTVPSTSVFDGVDKVVAVAVDYKEQQVFYSDLSAFVIGKFSLADPSDKEELALNIDTVDSIAVDWISKNVYWVDYIESLIMVCKEDGTVRTSIVNKPEQKPGMVALHPQKSMLFYTVTGTPTGIMSCDMDGQNCQHIVSNIKEPIGLVVDYSADRLYWGDAFHNIIESSDLSGLHKGTVAQDWGFGIYSMAIHKGTLYWTGHGSNEIHYTNIPGSGEIGKIQLWPGSRKVFGIVSVQQGQQKEGTNACSEENGGCPRLCVPKPDNKKICLPDASVNIRCLDDEFLCDVDFCIRRDRVCDAFPDCDDKSDERGCDKVSCRPDEFRCHSGKCIEGQLQCDGAEDCWEGEDERDCENSCKEDEFFCDNTCIDYHKRCDGFSDCGDETDEMNCENNKCPANHYQCKNKRCIPSSWVCNGVIDCSEGEEEDNCVATCSSTEWQCHDPRKLCVARTLLCDGAADCPDGSDESLAVCGGTQAPHEASEECSFNAFRCPGSSCIPQSWVCDGSEECDGGEDELNCPDRNITCLPHHFKCATGPDCVPDTWTCDDEKDCRDGSDEAALLCSTSPPSTPAPPIQFLGIHAVSCGEPDAYQCGSGECVPMGKVCDGNEHCMDGSDEGGSCDTACEKMGVFSGGCHEICSPQPSGPKCICEEGGILLEDQRTCRDLNECDVTPSPCSQFCVNKRHGYECRCAEGYFLDDDRHTCRAEDPVAYLLVSQDNEIRQLTIDQRHMTNVPMGSKARVMGLDFHGATGDLYWADSGRGRVRYLSAAEGKKLIMLTQQGKVMGVAVDWIGGNLYYIQAKAGAIRACRLRSDICRTVLSGLDDPIDIVLDPISGWMYWTSQGKKPQLSKAMMNGSNAQVLVDFDIIMPMGLALDHVQRRLFWTDRRKVTIQSVDLYGKNRHVIRLDPRKYIPCDVDVFEDYIYWTDQASNSVLRANKRTGSNIILLHNMTKQPNNLRVVHPLKQPSTNHQPCGSSTSPHCGYLCLLTPDGHTCHCPNGFHMVGKNCIKLANHTANAHHTGIYHIGTPTEIPGLFTKSAGKGWHPAGGRETSCDESPCLNNGTCTTSSQNTKPVCLCVEGYSGERCQNRTGLVLDYEVLSRNSYAWVGGLVGLIVLVVIGTVVLLYICQHKRKLKDPRGLISFVRFPSRKDKKAQKKRFTNPTYNPSFQEEDEDDYNANSTKTTITSAGSSESLDSCMLGLPEIREEMLSNEDIHPDLQPLRGHYQQV